MIDDQLTDEDLLASGEPEHFGCFYQRHVREVLGYMMRRTGDPEAAADLTAETFAAAIVARRRFRPGAAPAGAWLLTIAHRKLARYAPRVRGGAGAPAAGNGAPPAGRGDTALIRALGEEVTLNRWKQLPADQRTAIQARVLDERPYPEIASELGTSETAVRMRVSRGLWRRYEDDSGTRDQRGLHQRPARRPRRGDGPYERRSPRGRLAAGRYPRLLRRATPARIAAGAAIIVALVAVLTVARESDVEREAAPPGKKLVATDVENGVRFSLDGRVLTVQLLPNRPNATFEAVSGAGDQRDLPHHRRRAAG